MGLLPIIDIIGGIINKVIPDPKDKMNLQIQLAQLADQEAAREHSEMMGQIATNTEEAKNRNLFVSGWRPFIGWTGGVGLAYSFVFEPLASWIARVIFHYAGTFPVLDNGQLMTLVMGMLGFGGLRTYEKYKGVPDSTPLASVPQGPVAPQPPKRKILPFDIPGIGRPF